MLLLLAAAPTVGGSTLFGFDSLLFLTLLFIFGTAIVSAVYTRWSRDRCLKLFNDDVATLQRADGRITWGRLRVLSEGVEVEFPTPGTDRQGLRRSSVLVYPAELEGGNVLCLLRAEETLSNDGRNERRAQVERLFNPSLPRRTLRKMRNLVNTLKDAFSKALGVVVGQVAKANPSSRVLAGQQQHVTAMGETVLGKGVANAYEPLLEKHIGRPVIVDVKRPDGGVMGVAGFLAEYSAKYIAVLNVEHESADAMELRLPAEGEESTSATAGEATPSGRPMDVSARFEGPKLVLTNAGIDALLVRRLERDGFEPVDLHAVIPAGGRMELPARDVGGALLTITRLRRYDVIVPRGVGQVRHAGELLPKRGFLDDLGLDELPLIPSRDKSTT
jgi:hypothetical protein